MLLLDGVDLAAAAAAFGVGAGPECLDDDATETAEAPPRREDDAGVTATAEPMSGVGD